MKELVSDIKKEQADANINGDTLEEYETLEDIKVNKITRVVSTGKWKVTLDIFTEDSEVLTLKIPI